MLTFNIKKNRNRSIKKASYSMSGKENYFADWK
jgi:hypothetical protein